MSLPKLSIAQHLPAAAEVQSRTRELDVFGTDFTVPSSFAPQWLANVQPLIPLLKDTLGSAFDGIDLEDVNAASLVRAGGASNVSASSILDAFMAPENWQLVKVCLTGGEFDGIEYTGILVDVFGEQTPTLLDLKLGIPEWIALARTLGGAWGVGLGELLKPASSSAAAGTTSKPTSKRTTKSTRAGRSGDPRKRATSASGG